MAWGWGYYDEHGDWVDWDGGPWDDGVDWEYWDNSPYNWGDVGVWCLIGVALVAFAFGV